MKRKNYLFGKNDKGAKGNAMFYTLLQSCEMVGVNELEWLAQVLNRLSGWLLTYRSLINAQTADVA